MTYQPPVRDHLFILADILNIDQYGDLPGFSDAPMDVVSQIIEESGKFTAEVLAPLNAVGDKEGCHWSPDHTVTTPKGFKEAYDQLVEGGWPALGAEPAYGGQGLPHVINLSFTEMCSSANMAFGMYPGLTHGAYSAILAGGSPEQKDLYLPTTWRKTLSIWFWPASKVPQRGCAGFPCSLCLSSCLTPTVSPVRATASIAMALKRRWAFMATPPA